MVIFYLLPLLLVNLLVVYAQLDVQCGSPKGKPAVITYTGDAKAVIAFAVGGKKCQFVEDTATASFKLTIGYKKAPGIDCLLEHTSPTRPSYGTIVETRLLHPLVEGGDDKKYVIECVFTPIKKDVSVKVDLEPKYNPPIFVLKSSGITAKSLFSLTLTNMNHAKFTTPVSESQIVKIRSTMTPKNGEKGYQPLECTAMSADQKVKLLILSDGCGTGFPFKPTQGFQVKGIYGDSPNFRMFRIKKNQGVIFKCTFVICPSKCDENSCHKHPSVGRRKRDINMRKRRSLGVKYNGLGLISHEESKGIDTADIHHELANDTQGTVTVNKQDKKNLVFHDSIDSDGFNVVTTNTQDTPNSSLKTNDQKAVKPNGPNAIQSDQGSAFHPLKTKFKQDFAGWYQFKKELKDESTRMDAENQSYLDAERQFDQGSNEPLDKADSFEPDSASKKIEDSVDKTTNQKMSNEPKENLTTKDSENTDFTDNEDLKNAPIWNEPNEIESADTEEIKGDIPLFNEGSEWEDAGSDGMSDIQQQESALTKVTSEVYKETGIDSNEVNTEGINHSESFSESEISEADSLKENEGNVNSQQPELGPGDLDVQEPLFPQSAQNVRKKRNALRNSGFVLKDVKLENFADNPNSQILNDVPESGADIFDNAGKREPSLPDLPELEPEDGSIENANQSPDDETDIQPDIQEVENLSEGEEDDSFQDSLSKDLGFSESSYASTGDFVTSNNEEVDVADEYEASNLQQDYNDENAEQTAENEADNLNIDQEPTEQIETGDDVNSENDENLNTANQSQEDFEDVDNELPPESLQYTSDQDSTVANDNPLGVKADEKAAAALEHDQSKYNLDAAAPLELDKPQSAPLFEDAAAATRDATS